MTVVRASLPRTTRLFLPLRSNRNVMTCTIIFTDAVRIEIFLINTNSVSRRRLRRRFFSPIEWQRSRCEIPCVMRQTRLYDSRISAFYTIIFYAYEELNICTRSSIQFPYPLLTRRPNRLFWGGECSQLRRNQTRVRRPRGVGAWSLALY